MNITTTGISNTRNWKRFKAHHVAAVAGVALAISAVIGLGTGISNSQPVAQQQRVVSAADIAASVLSTERATYDFNATSAVKTQPLFATAADAEEAAKSLLGAPESSIRTLSNDDLAASVLSSEMAAYDFSAKLEQRLASDADIAASVLSTELAAWVQ